MNKRTFLFSCAAFAAAMSLTGTTRSLLALAASPGTGSDDDRILRLTRTAALKLNFITAKDMANIVRRKKGRHLILSLQSRQEYLAGHIPGALLFAPEDLANVQKLTDFINKLPQNKSIVLTCPNGHLSGAVMLFLRQLGFDATALAFGMDGWNRAYAGTGAYPGDIGGAVSREAALMTPSEEPLEPGFSGLDDQALIVHGSHGNFLRELPQLTARERPDNTIMFCLRRPEDYAAGHIPGAINIPSEAFYAGDEIILQIPRDKRVMLICYVGHYSCGAALLLNQLGYDAYSLEWGMAGWNNKYIGPIADILAHNSARAVEQGQGGEFMES